MLNSSGYIVNTLFKSSEPRFTGRLGDVTPFFKEIGFLALVMVGDLEDCIKATLDDFGSKLLEPIDNGEGLRSLFLRAWKFN